MRLNGMGFVGAFLVIMTATIIMIMLLAPDSKRERRESNTACACAAQTVPQRKFLIFWKEKEQESDKELKVFKISDKLFDTIQDAWKTVPPNAAEVRIITVKLD